MLHKVMRYGFEFWEAPRNTGPFFEDVDPEEIMRRARLHLARQRFELLANIVALVSFEPNAECRLENAESEKNGAALAVQAGTASPYPKKSAKRKYVRKKAGAYDREVWGDLADLSDEEPIEALERLGIPRDENAEQKNRTPEIEVIQKRVMREFAVTEQEFFASGLWEPALARAVSMALCRALTDISAPEIGAAHRREHTAVRYAVKRVERLRAEDGAFAVRIARLEAELGGGQGYAEAA